MRLVSLVASNTEIVCALGRGDWLVGVDDYSDEPPWVTRLPRVGRDLDVDVERVAALRPDLVLASLSVPGMERVVERLRERGLPLVVIPSSGLAGVFDGIRAVGELLDADAGAADVAGRLRERIAAVSDRVRSLPPVRTYWEWWPRPPITAGQRSWMTELLTLAGGRNVFADLDAESGVVTLEAVLARAPEVAVLCWCGARKPAQPRRFLERPGWGVLPAAREGRVYVVLEPRYGRPGPRLAEGAEELARLLHPELAAGAG
jgi:iron complex transport system substrate-binding protein